MTAETTRRTHPVPATADADGAAEGAGAGAGERTKKDAAAPLPAGAVNYAAERLRLLTDRACTGAARRAGLAQLTDSWLAGLHTAASLAEPAAPAPPGSHPTGAVQGRAAAPDGTALIALGGYGRGELSPRSDLDLLLLHTPGTDPDALAGLADRLWYPVWDQGLSLDHAVRTPEGTHHTAANDLKVRLGLLDARHIAGDRALTDALRTAVVADWRAEAPVRLPALHQLTRERGLRHGELPFLLEPDLKESRGGLRDVAALRAIAASWLADAPRTGLEEAHRTLLDVRDALHLTTGRATDRLAQEDQPQVADALGLLDIDALLRTVYEAARTIAYASDVTWREVARVLRARSAGGHGRARTPALRTPLADGVVEADGEVGLARTARPERDPVLPLRAAAAAARAGLPLALPTAHRLAATAAPLPVPWPSEAREELVTLLGSGRDLLPVWEAMDAAGLITRLLPDWERVACRPQRNPVHRWTVDRHLVETAVRARALTRQVSRPDLLLVAAVLHDIGKGWPGDHSVRGETIARDMAARIGFGAADTQTLATLVRHHLLLIRTATRRDLTDPATAASVAETVRDTGTLELLHALTEADARATGPAAWSSWRAGLVAELVRRVARLLRAGTRPDDSAPTVPPGPPAPAAVAERLAVEAVRTGAPALHLDTGGARAGAGGSARSAAPGPQPEGGEPEPVGVELTVASTERPGLLPAVAGVLALHRLTVRSAEVRVLDPAGQGEVLLLDWRVAATYGALPEAERLRADLVRALEGSLDLTGRLAEREAARRPRRRRGAAPPPPRVSVAPLGSRRATVLEVRAEDAPGLLYRIGHALEAHRARVLSAHVSTLGGNAVDAFYVTGPGGGPLSPGDASRLASAVEHELAPPAA